MILATSTATVLVAYFLTSKVVAVDRGVDGIAELGVAMAISNVFAMVADVNVGQELTRRVAALSRGADHTDEQARLIGTGLAITAVGSTVAMLVLLGLAPWLGDQLDLTGGQVLLAGASGACTLLAQQLFNGLSGLGETRTLAFGAAARSVMVFVAFALCLGRFGMSVTASYSVGMVCGLLASVVVSGGQLPWRRGAPRSVSVAELLRSGLVLTATLTAYTGVGLMLPIVVAARAGADPTGWFRAATLLSGGILQFFNSSMRYEFLPRLSRAMSPALADRRVRAEMSTLVPAMGILALLLVPLRTIALPLFFSGDFDKAATLVSWVLVGDLLRVVVAIVGYAIYARRGVGWLLLVELVGGLPLLVLIWVAASSTAPLDRLGAAYVGAHVVAVVGAIVIGRRRLLSSVPWRQLGLAALAAGGIGAGSSLAGVHPLLPFVVSAVVIAMLGRELLRGRAGRRSDGSADEAGAVGAVGAVDAHPPEPVARPSAATAMDAHLVVDRRPPIATDAGRSGARPPHVADRGVTSGSDLPHSPLMLARCRRQGTLIGLLTVLGTATQFRPAGGVGLPELALIGYLFVAWPVARGVRHLWVGTRATRFLVAFGLASLVGGVLDVAVFDGSPLTVVTGVAAITLLLVCTLFSLTRADAASMLRAWGRTFGGGFLLSQFAIFAVIRVTPLPGPLQPMWFGVRFQGWTSNPNQLAFLSAVATGAVLLACSSWAARSAACLATLLLSTAAVSDGFRLALVASVGAVIVTHLSSPARRLRPLARVLSWAAAMAGLAGTIALLGVLASRAAAVAASGNQGSDRATLWSRCVVVIARAPLTGLGPGGHSHLEAVPGPMECHNSILDVGSNAGAIVALVFTALFVRLALRAWRRLDVVVVLVVVQLFVMMLFGYLLRYPPLWFLIVLVEVRQSRQLTSWRPGRTVMPPIGDSPSLAHAAT